MSALITDKIGDEWIRNLESIDQLKNYADEPKFAEQVDWHSWLNQSAMLILI